MAAFLVSKRDGANLNLALADGGSVEVFPGVGGGTTGAALLIFPTIAAMSAYNASSPVVLSQGQLAVVQSNNSLWELAPGSESADGITTATVTAPPFGLALWQRVNVSLNLPTDLVHLNWWVDPQNVSGTASDENTGNGPTTPLKHVAEVYRRLGYSWEPLIDGITVSVILMSSNTIDDPYLFKPVFVNGGRMLLTSNFGSLATSFTGTLLAVTAKSRSGNTPLKSTFTTTTGAVAAHMLLVNTTRGSSKAFAVKNASGTWTLSQPLASYAGTGAALSVAEVDTWANGDTIQGFVLPSANVGRIGGRSVDLNLDLGQSHQVVLLTLVDPQGTGTLDPVFVEAESAPLLYNCVTNRALSVSSNVTAAQAIFLSCDHVEQLFMGSNIFNGNAFRGCSFEQTVASIGGVVFSGDCQNYGNSLVGAGSIQDGFYLGPSSLLAFAGGQFSSAAPIYGDSTATLNAQQGTLTYNAPASTALPFSTGGGTLEVGGATSVYSNASAGTVTVHKVTGLTAALLDAAAGTTGYGGLAYIPGVAAITSGAVP